MERPAKRKCTAAGTGKVPCKYGKKCYRKNLEHLKQFKHYDDDEADEEVLSKDVVNNAEAADACESVQTGETIHPACVGSGSQEHKKLPTSHGEIIKCIEGLFLVKMPPDFYDFWQFCEQLNEDNPADALYDTLGLQLVGPFDALSGKLTGRNIKCMDDALCHWRYYYDPPEMQTVLRGDDEKLYHLGYFRDSPKEMPVFVASNFAQDSCKICKVGGNLFAAISKEISTALKKAKDSVMKAKLKKLNGTLIEFAEAKKYALDEATKKRPKPMAATFHGAGMVVPYNSATEVGYRPLPVSDAELRALLRKISSSSTDELHKKNMVELQDIIMNVHLANDECDYGMGLELGLDLFCFGCPKLHSVLLHIITLAYRLLDREEFAQIITAHLSRRKKGADLSVIDTP